jgi:hypothetical protein
MNASGASPSAEPEECDTSNPKFIHPENADAMAKMIVDGTEKGPAAKKRGPNKTPDDRDLEDAFKNFHRDNKPKKLDNGRYQYPLMRSSLRPHQHLGASWMRWKEQAVEEPFGGILADQMGEYLTNLHEMKFSGLATKILRTWENYSGLALRRGRQARSKSKEDGPQHDTDRGQEVQYHTVAEGDQEALPRESYW